MIRHNNIGRNFAGSVISVVLLLLCIFASSCHRRPLEDPDYNTRIKVRVNTDSIRNVTCGIYNDKIPVPEIQMDVMHVILFEKDSDEIACETFLTDYETDEQGHRTFFGDLSLSPGTYRLYSYNFGTESTLIRDQYNWESAEAYALGVSQKISNAFSTKVQEGDLFTYIPDHLVVARAPQETIPYHTGIYTVETEAQSVVESYYLQIKVEGLVYVNTATAVLSGMSSANYITLGDRVDDPQSTVYFELQKSEDNGEPVICAVFNTFGRPDGSTNDLEVTFDIQTKSGTTVQRTFNISDLFLSENCRKHNWLLLEETIKIDPPDPSGGSSGFDPKVEDWENEEHEIVI